LALLYRTRDRHARDRPAAGQQSRSTCRAA
jgi:hypothetical protein